MRLKLSSTIREAGWTRIVCMPCAQRLSSSWTYSSRSQTCLPCGLPFGRKSWASCVMTTIQHCARESRFEEPTVMMILKCTDGDSLLYTPKTTTCRLSNASCGPSSTYRSASLSLLNPSVQGLSGMRIYTKRMNHSSTTGSTCPGCLEKSKPRSKGGDGVFDRSSGFGGAQRTDDRFVYVLLHFIDTLSICTTSAFHVVPRASRRTEVSRLICTQGLFLLLRCREAADGRRADNSRHVSRFHFICPSRRFPG
ncbi:hypothetical protein BDY17DRAFT_11135 [Neohortaea acidophila]|uniref:Uncharacterized protein n=1 Tax=Neohortaea acidophila TaxID=245834 RepID=A0A6A6Q711_9PEZI|nr:uncharacterized protein BDY17DRAFT_11135 [Neohortaea acidophila]KAF2487423.1 hypothetical protein BDY17DRAFT_11135 [Neohortaea acidophila]